MDMSRTTSQVSSPEPLDGTVGPAADLAKMKLPPDSGSIADRCRSVRESLLTLAQGEDKTQFPFSSLGLEDILDRFNLWAGNMGAWHPPHSRMSLDSRLSESPEVRHQIFQLLKDLYEAIQDGEATPAFPGSTSCSLNTVKTACFEDDNCRTIATNSMQDVVATPDDEVLEDEEESFSKDEQFTLLIDMMNECMKALFRIGTLVRREVTYDRFQRALQRSRFSFPEQFDTNYVEQKHPKLRGAAGRTLAARLGRANAKRRQFIKYGRDHRTRLELDMESHQEIEPSAKATLSVDLEAPTERLSSKATTFVMPAENWNSGFLEAPIEDEDDSTSLLTASTTFDSERSLKLVTLAEIGPEGKHFECPLCFTLQSFRTERAWRNHAYDDLKAYICTYGGRDCDNEMFVDRATWFNHELQAHRSLFTCKLCDEQMDQQEDLRNHVLAEHANFPSGQFSILLEQGRLVPSHLKAQDCPFCDDWARSIYSRRNLEESQTEFESNCPDVLVALSKFKKHVATHQEQVTLFTVPKSTDFGGPDESVQNVGSNVSVHISSEGSAAMSYASDAFVVEAGGPNAQMEETKDAAAEEAAGESRPRVLIAEDNPINLAVLRRLLLHEGIHDISAAKDGQEAYDIVKENLERNEEFDLIFMDIQMPRLSGLASTQLIRTLGCETPIVAVTPASSDTSRAHELIQRGVNEVILKPFRQPTIRKVLQRFGIASGDAARSSLTRELYMHDSYQTPTVDVESLISPLEAFLATAPSGDVGDSGEGIPYISSVTALIAEALRGPGRVNVADLIDVLPNLHHNEIMNLRTEYKRLVKVGPDQKGVNVAKHIRARLKDDDNRLMTAAYATALGMWESEGYWISLSLTMGNKTPKGQQLLIESLLGRSNTEARLIEDGFRIHSNKLEREHGTSLENFLDPYLRQGEAWFREAVKEVLSGHKMEERDHSGQPQPIDMQLVEKDADELFEAVAGERGAATTISQIVVLRSDAHLGEALTIYQRKYESDFLADALKGIMQLRDDVLFHVLYGAQNRPTRDAWLLRQALRPRGNDDIQHELLISRLVRAHWNGYYLSAVKQAYRDQYGQDLVDDIARETSGEWGAFCVALAQSNLQWDETSRDTHAAM